MGLRKSTEINEISKALTEFQKTAPKIVKDKTAKVGSYSYTYADLAGIWDKIRGNLADNKLSVIQSPTTTAGGEAALTTVLAHESGQWLEDTMVMKVVQDTPQGHGSAISYARRYALTAMLGLVADDDNDARDHNGLSPIQKKQLFGTAKKVMPSLGEDPLSIVRFLNEIVGKHPSRILSNEFDDAIAAVESYNDKQGNIDQRNDWYRKDPRRHA